MSTATKVKGQAKVQKKSRSWHRARKPRPVRPLDEPKANNHAARHEAKKAATVAHAASILAEAEAKRVAAEESAFQAALAAVPAANVLSSPAEPAGDFDDTDPAGIEVGQ